MPSRAACPHCNTAFTPDAGVQLDDCPTCGRAVEIQPAPAPLPRSAHAFECPLSHPLGKICTCGAEKPAPQPALEKCEGCGCEIQTNWPCFHTMRGAVCMRCEGAEIEVFRVSLPGDDGGYIDRDMPSDYFAGMDVGDAYVVHRESMRLLQYLNLPEFGGF